MIKNKQAVIHYSGGTDSTAVVCLKATEFEKIHLISYKRFGIFKIGNIDKNIERLYKLFGKDKFIRKIIDINDIYNFVSYDDYFYNLKKFGLFNLAVCGLCKLSMHIRTIIYCIDNSIHNVFDGANKYTANSLAIDQIKEFINVINNLYNVFGISYEAPVYDMKANPEITWQIKFGIEKIKDFEERTTGKILKDFNFFKDNNIKGTKQDKQMQARCFQQFLQNIALKYYYVNEKGEQKFRNRIKEFFAEKADKMIKYLHEYIEKKENSRLYKYLIF